MRHAQPAADGSIVVTWAPRGRAASSSAVTDGGGGTRPRSVHAPASALAGRGMAIVDVLADEWWTERTPTRARTVHADPARLSRRVHAAGPAA